uniref:Uncharacterized protein n=1 Tax=Plectus sambesii TaxID=2011161 RepID=A0A914VVH0_9BILA
MPRLTAYDRRRMFLDLSAKPLEVWTCPVAQPASSSTSTAASTTCDVDESQPCKTSAVKNVERLFDYELVDCNGYGRQHMIGLAPTVPALSPDLLALEGKQLNRLKDEAYPEHASLAMEAPLALLSFLGPFEWRSFDVVCTKTFPATLYRFCSNEERFYRFDVERIGSTVFVQEADVGDARAGPNYLLSLVENVTSRPSRGYRQAIKYDFGGLRLLVRLHVDLAEVESDEQADVRIELSSDRSILGQRNALEQVDPILEALKEFIPTAQSLTEYMARCEARPFPLPNSSVCLQGGYRRPSSTCCTPIQVMTRGVAKLAESSLPNKWPNLHFGGTERLLVAIHERGEVKGSPVIFHADDIAPVDREEALARAATVLNTIVTFIRAQPAASGNHFALIWINDSNGNDDEPLGKENISIYRRFPKQTNTFLSDSLKSVVL